MTYTNHSDPKKNPRYPRFVSDRADALLDEIDATQARQLYGELKKTSFAKWSTWLEDKRIAIAEYDQLSPAARKRRLQNPGQTDALWLHHACVFSELWRVRVNNSYLQLPPQGAALDTPQAQRAMMLAVVTAYNQIDQRDLWPFDLPAKTDPFPFGES